LGGLGLLLFGLGAGVGHSEGVFDGVELELALLDLLGLEASFDGLDVLVGALDVTRVEGPDHWFSFFWLFIDWFWFLIGSGLDNLLFGGFLLLIDLFFGGGRTGAVFIVGQLVPSVLY